MTLDHPLRLAVGSHQAGSGKGCAMNLISWENGDTTITDLAAVRGVLTLADELDLRADAKGSHPMPGYDEGYRAGLSDGEGYAADRLRAVIASALGEA